MGWARVSYSCPALKWYGQQLLYLLCKDKQCPGALWGRKLPCCPGGRGSFFQESLSGEDTVPCRMLPRAPRQARGARESPAPWQDEGQFLSSGRSQRAQNWWLFPANRHGKGGRGSVWAVEPESKASSHRSRGQGLFLQDAPGEKAGLGSHWAVKGSCPWSLQHTGGPGGDRVSSPWHPELLLPHATKCSSVRSW